MLAIFLIHLVYGNRAKQPHATVFFCRGQRLNRAFARAFVFLPGPPQPPGQARSSPTQRLPGLPDQAHANPTRHK
jgi:hypothetical protein